MSQEELNSLIELVILGLGIGCVTYGIGFFFGRGVAILLLGLYLVVNVIYRVHGQ